MEEGLTARQMSPGGAGGLVPVWKPALAALLSLVFAGLGHLFVRAYLRAFAFFVQPRF